MSCRSILGFWELMCYNKLRQKSPSLSKSLRLILIWLYPKSLRKDNKLSPFSESGTQECRISAIPAIWTLSCKFSSHRRISKTNMLRVLKNIS
jgi:hypothetical protein